MMKLLLAICLCLTEIGFAQDSVLYQNINDEWFHNNGRQGLKVGDTIPDISLGPIINNLTGKERFFDFKGKLLILDFWNTGCSICFDQFPYMEKLQQEFGNRIQIMLVNPFETRQQIEKILGRLKNRVLPNLPSVVAEEKFSDIGPRIYDSSVFLKLFPLREVPHHVWIDGNGKINLIGGYQNTYAEKIRNQLEGEKITYLKNNASVPDLGVDRTKPYFKILGSLKSTPVSFGAFITPYNNEIAGESNKIIDSNAGTFTEYFINKDLLSIYETGPFYKELREQVSKLLYTPFYFYDDFVVLLNDVDISRLSSKETFLERKPTDKDYLRSRYCYEQVVPLGMADSTRRQYMLEDLNRFSAINLGIVASLERVKIPCYILVRTSERDKISSLSRTINLNTTSKADVKRIVTYESGEPLESLINWTIRRNSNLQFFMEQNKKKGNPFLIINETGWDRDMVVNMMLPAEGLCTINDLRNALKPYDLDIIENSREFECAIFRKVK